MKYTSLKDIIFGLEYGNNIHICIVFLKNYGNSLTILDNKSIVHSKPICDFMKSRENGLSRCMNCRNIALRRAIDTKESFGGLCCNGIYEYVRPVLVDDEVACVIFIGNILPEINKRKLLNSIGVPKNFIDSLQVNCNEEDCESIANIIENQIQLLLKKYSNVDEGFDPTIRNIKNYIKENYANDFSISELASAFSYNEQYLGKLFKSKTGICISEYVNNQKLDRAEELLQNPDISITDVASISGFANVTYFNKLFKERFGFSPSKFKKNFSNAKKN